VGLDFSVIGEVTDTGKLIIAEEGKKVAEIPISLISEEAPVYDRPYSEPAYIRETRGFDLSSIPVPKDMNRVFLKLLSSPTLSDKRWIWEQYDHMVRTNTVVLPGSDAAVVRIKDTKKALAMTSTATRPLLPRPVYGEGSRSREREEPRLLGSPSPRDYRLPQLREP
jgi:phosphoribosylformylglycinamidine synthase